MDYGNESKRLDDAGCETHWYGPVAPSEIERAENLLGVKLPADYKAFLAQLGGGGVDGDGLGGIKEQAQVQRYGTIVGDTLRLRSEWALEESLVVLRIDEEEYAWCLDCSAAGNGRVVGLSRGTGEKPELCEESFADYFRDYLEEQVELAEDE